jgi:hypothetical protein
MRLPFVHWLPKGAPQQLAIRVLLALGFGAPFFTEYSNPERAKIFSEFSENVTFYRTPKELARLSADQGMVMKSLAHEKIICRGGLAASVASIPLLGPFLSEAWATALERCIITVKDETVLGPR